ncbi:ArsR/SmtB family transcription factor [Pseudothermotoga sp.]|nr:metalloregulator ArsR/SmtB family transcription factor [Pseudothermotoga sp.]MDW8139670.1 metalloregulator ArsR/SmtB family transcription factor [Pseudothermotoga sp.]
MENVCGEKHEHGDLVAKVSSQLESKQVVERMVQLLRACANETRLKILIALSKSDLCTCDLSQILSLSPSAVSHQLRVLKLSNLVDSIRVGKQVVHKLKDKHVLDLISSALEHAKE